VQFNVSLRVALEDVCGGNFVRTKTLLSYENARDSLELLCREKFKVIKSCSFLCSLCDHCDAVAYDRYALAVLTACAHVPALSL